MADLLVDSASGSALRPGQSRERSVRSGRLAHEKTVEQIIAPATAIMLRPHEWIVRQDDPATAFFIVIDGWVKLYRSTPSGDAYSQRLSQ